MLVLNLINSTISLGGIFGTGLLLGGIIGFLISWSRTRKRIKRKVDEYSKGLLSKKEARIKWIEKKNERLIDQRDRALAKVKAIKKIAESDVINVDEE